MWIAWFCGFVGLLREFVSLKFKNSQTHIFKLRGFVDLWVCGLWVCGYLGLWVCGFVGLWVCGFWVCLMRLNSQLATSFSCFKC